MRSKEDIRRRRIIIWVSIAVFILLLISLTVIFSERVFNKIDAFSEFTVRELDKDPSFMLNIYVDKYYKAIDAINILRYRKNLFDGSFPVYDLKLSANDVDHFNELSVKYLAQGYKDDESNTWRDSKLTVGNQKYDVKVKFHGDTITHWGGNLNSLRVKMTSDNYVNGMKSFSFILFEDRFLASKITNQLSKELGLYNAVDDLVVLRINGVKQGLYYLQEFPDDGFLEHNQCSSCEIFSPNDNIFVDHYNDSYGVYLEVNHVTPFDYELGKITLSDDTGLDHAKVSYAVDDLLKDFEEGNVEKTLSHFDIDQLSSFEALRRIIGSNHMVAGDNLKMVYSASLGKFYPVPISEGIWKLRLKKGGIEHYINKYERVDIELFHLLNQNEELRHMTNQKLYSFITNNGDSFLKEVDEINNKVIPYLSSYKMNSWSPDFAKFKLRSQRNAIARNMRLIKGNLEYSKVYINTVVSGNKVSMEIMPDSISRISFSELVLFNQSAYSGGITVIYSNGKNTITKTTEVNKLSAINMTGLVSSFYFSAGLDEELCPAKKSYYLDIVFEDTDKINTPSFKIGMINDITFKPLSEKDININVANREDFYEDSKYLSFSQFALKYPQFNWDFSNNILTLKSGEYTVDKDLIIPKFSSFIIEPGTKIKIAEDKAVFSYSPLEIEGTAAKPVIVEALDKSKPFGTFAAVGDKDGKCIINWLDLSGGNEKFINGMYLSGALAIHGYDISMTNSKIHHNNADDGMNFKYSTVFLDNNDVYENYADQFDCDFCKGVVKNSEFRGAPPTKASSEYGVVNPDTFKKIISNQSLVKFSNQGDGLDLSGSILLIKDNFFRYLGDKGVSVGEETDAVLFNNRFSNNNLTVAVKDLSSAFFINNTFKENLVVFASYQKKPIFGGGTSYVFENSYENNLEMYSIDSKSKLYNVSIKDTPALIDSIKNEEMSQLFNQTEKIKESAK